MNKSVSKDNALISIIVPVYNAEAYLKKCVDSILNQTYHNLEVLLIDDGSTDQSGKICDNYESVDSRIVTYHKANEGLGFTRNYGINKSKGDYLYFLDSDDYIIPDAIEKLLDTAKANDADLVIAGFNKFNDNGKIVFTEKYDNQFFEGKQIMDSLLPRMIGSAPNCRDSIFVMACGKLYKASTIKNNGIYFPSEREIQSEDLAFQLEYIPTLDKCIVIDHIGYCYRYNPESLSTKYKKDRFVQLKKVYEHTIKRINDYRLPKDTSLRADKMFFVQLKSILSQEINHFSDSNISRNNIKLILNDNLLRSIVNDYPIHMLNFKQKLFVLMMKYRMTDMLILAIKYIESHGGLN